MKLLRYLSIALLAIPLAVQADFDNTDPVDLLALQTEVNTDPIGMGYAPNTGTPPLLNLLNTATANVGNDVTGEDLTPRLLLDAVEPEDLTVGSKLSQGSLDYIKLVIQMSSNLDDNIEAYRIKIHTIFTWSPGPVTLTNLQAQSRRISRVEVLFGLDTVLTKTDWLLSRDYQP